MNTKLLEQIHAYTVRKTNQNESAQLFCLQGLSFEMAVLFEEYVHNGHPILHNGEILELFVLDSDHLRTDSKYYIDEAAAVSRRNDATHHFVIIQPYGTTSSLSMETTVGVIGIDNASFSEIAELRTSEMYIAIISSAILPTEASADYATDLIDASVNELLSKDDVYIKDVWEFLAGLLDITKDGFNIDQIEVYCGYPSSRGIAYSEAKKVQKVFHKELFEALNDTVVADEMFDALVTDSERDDTIFTPEDVDSFREFVDVQLPRLDSMPHYAFAHTYRESREYPSWWKNLRLQDIIKAIRGSEDKTALDVSAVGAIAGQCGVKKQPLVFKDKIKFKVKSNLSSDDEFQVRKGKSGNPPEQEISIPPGGEIVYHQALTEEERNTSKENRGKVKLFLGSKHTRKTYSCDVQVLSCLKSGMYFTVKDSENIHKIKPFKIKNRRESKTFRCEVSLFGSGDVTCQLFVSDTARLVVAPVQYEDQNHESQYFNFRAEKSNDEYFTFRISAYNGLSFRFKGAANGEEYTYEVEFFVKQTNSSDETSETWYDEHLRRNLLRLNRPLSQLDYQEVVLPAGKDIYQFEQELLQVAAAGQGGYPIVLGDDYRRVQRQGVRPDFEQPVKYTTTPFSTNVDTRPNFESWKNSFDSFGVSYKNSRYELFSRLAVDYPEKRIEEIDFGALPDDYHQLIEAYAYSYNEWLKKDYINASITELIWVYPTRQNNTLDESPQEIIVPPFHPLRLSWLYRTQQLMSDSEGIRPNSAVSIFDSDTLPDLIYLPIADIGGRGGSVRAIPFFSVRSSSHYWGVLRDCTKKPASLSSYQHLWSDVFGISFEQSAQIITKEQVESALDDAREMCLAKPSLSVSFSGASCDSICRDGIVSWNKQFIDATNNDVLKFGPRRLKIYDVGGTHLPSNEAIASIGDQSNGMIQWFAPDKDVGSVDLSIATLSAREPVIRESTLGESVTVAGGLGCYRTRQLKAGAYLIESRKTKAVIGWRDKLDNLSQAITSILNGFSIHAGLNLQEEKTHIGYPTDVRSLLSNEKSSYYAVSSADVDHACFVAESGVGGAYLWDYRLPQNNSGARSSDGFYLLAKETPVMYRAVAQAISSVSGSNRDISDAVIKNTLHITAQRGIPTVKDLTLGGTKALGEVGILIAVSVLQSDITTSLFKGVFPPLIEKDGMVWLNFVVPFDPFRKQFETLLHSGDKKVRPDLACISVFCEKKDSNLLPQSIKFSFVEVKARTHRFSDTDKQAALKQYSTCKTILGDAIREEKQSLQVLAVYDFLISLFTFGFRVFSTFKDADKLNLDNFYTDVIAAFFAKKNFIEIEKEPRLLVVDSGNSTVSDCHSGVHRVLTLNGSAVCNNIATGVDIDLPEGLESYWGLISTSRSIDENLEKEENISSAETNLIGNQDNKMGNSEAEEDIKTIDSGITQAGNVEKRSDIDAENCGVIKEESIRIEKADKGITVDVIQSADMEDELVTTRKDLLDALSEYNIKATLVEDPKFSPNGIIFIFDGSPRSMSVSSIQSRITDIKVRFGVDIRRVIPLRRRVSIHVAREKRQTVKWEQEWPLRKEECTKLKKLYIGVAEEDGSPLFLDPTESHAPHTLVAGATKSGKSVLLRNLLFGIASIYRPVDSRIILIDPKMGQDYYAFKGLPHLYDGQGGNNLIVSQEAASSMLTSLVEEMNRRTVLLTKYQSENLQQYHKVVSRDSEDWMPYLWVFHDEFASWMLDKSYKQLVDSTISQLAVMARSVGIHLIFATQRPSAEVVSPQTRSNLGNRLVLKVSDEGNSRIALGRTGAESLLGGGHILVKREGEDGDEPIEGQVAFHDKEDISSAVKEMIAHYANEHLEVPLISKRCEGIS